MTGETVEIRKALRSLWLQLPMIMGFLGCRYELLNGNGGEGEGRVKHSVDGSSLDRE